jgi:hypothetical protein
LAFWKLLKGCSNVFSPTRFIVVHTAGSADRTVKFFDLETFELIGSAGPEVSTLLKCSIVLATESLTKLSVSDWILLNTISAIEKGKAILLQKMVHR